MAIIALLVQALLPSLIHAAAPRNGDLAEICTAFGIKKVVLPESGAPDSEVQRLHCSVCSLADAFALPACLPALRVPVQVSFPPPPAAESQRYAATQLSVYPRGPPIPS